MSYFKTIQMKLYGISGLGADSRVFNFLNLDCELIPVEWIEPHKNERIEKYAARLAQVINQQEEFGIIGVSFGGLIAVEISKLLNPKITILISSVETSTELRTIYRFVGKLKIIKIVPKRLLNPSFFIANWFFGAQNKRLLKQILEDTNPKFVKWALNELVNWRNKEFLANPILKINGTKDKLIPPHKSSNQAIIDNGSHFMIVDKADEISEIINREMRIM